MLNTHDKEALLQFLKDWAKAMQQILDARFHKNKVAHIIIALDTGNEPTITFATNLRDADFKRALRILADRINERKIELLN